MSPTRKRKPPPTSPRRSQRLAKARPTVEASDPSFEMELAIAPPDRIPAGTQLGAPLVVTFQASKLKRRPATAEGVSGQDLSGVWAYLSLMNEDRSRILAPPRTDLLHGEPAASIYPLHPANNNPFAYAVFPALTLTTPGRYCFRINIIDMNSMSGTAKLLPAIHSHVFDVVDDVRPLQKDPTIEKRLNQLRKMGVRL